MNTSTRRLAAAAAAALIVLAVPACGSGGDDPAAQNRTGRGPITFVQGKDNTGDVKNIVAKWNTRHPDQPVTLKEQTDNADQQHDDLVQHFKSQDAGYDVVTVDVVWTAEFAAQGWLQPLEGDFAIDTRDLLKAAVAAATYQGKLYAAPATSDGGMLYYRSDLVPKPPATWDELRADCDIAKVHGMACYAGQFAKYEGLTVNAAEAIHAAGGQIVGADGKTAAVDSPEAKRGLGFLADAYRRGDIPKEAVTYQEEQGRQAFEDGKLLFLRNWSYVYNLATEDGASKVKGKFAVAPEPGPTGIGTSTLGGHNLGVNVYSAHKATAIDFMRFMETPEIQRQVLVNESNAPVLASLYADPQLLADPKLGYLKTLGESLNSARSRPVTPFYPAVTKAIQDNAYAAIKGDKSVDQALHDMQAAINSADGS
ncbi:ABC transporter substrate-binding protein [Amycolatopsis australiensis]|uniref:Carbohydrate ABC transporter substrate-binding protein, CUT1 family n=1 Tax=Amycolatopsis australiensis TaxID=546364 RepID=A0A1K1RU10_9PSEU|nr:ABC transporter substrate-binding protein [Amycolatopsis australiensis]SFW75223.1 carbohydrate ABC transporter substrate-binding protein, CUT1 family [Amycolatopsis australiensis]